MQAFLHLADSGLTLPDLSLRLYASGVPLIVEGGVTLTQLDTGPDYVLTDLPDLDGGLTVTLETPPGVFHAYRLGLAAMQPAEVVIPIREVFADPAASLEIVVFQGAATFSPVVVEQLALDGEYLVSGWSSPSPRGESWRVRWVYGEQVFSFPWTGAAPLDEAFYVTVEAVGGSAAPLAVTAWAPESASILAVEEGA